ncbi:transketolase [Chitiniphilus purpureus]|uniref:Transketolase n=1 Tax=Chitiniphilus purpureus TaxID=2981137 RepID=A0ABY6DQ24_9NEIS|nr:transketolase [Chitiniphilus sp. CD1]UXY15803.1 transketolase [Chitiniphilus sp. CD1]
MDDFNQNSLKTTACAIRRLIIESIYKAQTGHAGPSLSLVEVLTALYFRHLKLRPSDPDDPTRDRLILSKGHAAPVLYATLAQAGFFPVEWLDSLRKLGSPLQGHPNVGLVPGIEASTGSLGQGISISLGLAIGLRRRQLPSRVYCIVGDGELQEGQNWEAMMATAAFKVNNLTVIVDRNGLQNDGATETIMPLGDLSAKVESFGWNTVEINGHDFNQIDQALSAVKINDRPTMIIAHTIKGKGISFMEGIVKWHHHPISSEEYQHAMAELE